MEIQITSRHNKASQALQETLTDELNKMEKFFDKITSCKVILDSEHIDKTVEITMNTQGHQLVSTGKSDILGKAIDDALSKTERQLKKLKQKIKNHKAP